MSFKPINDNVLIQFVASSEQSVGGLYIPPKAQDGKRAVVKAVPDPHIEATNDVHFEYVPLDPGQEVLVQDKGKCIEVVVDDETCHITSVQNILGFFEE